MANLHYVRDTMLPQATPPITERGAIKWLRENLFSGVYNSILTLVAIYVVYQLVQAVLPWLLNGVWTANSLGECRSIIAANGGETGACWAMINARWFQWVFGFYPQDLYWRPTLAFVLMLVALAPVLFSAVPKQLLWFTLLYPAICFWLLWGGSVWAPILVVFGLVIAIAAGLLASRNGGRIMGTLVSLLLLVVFFFDPVSPLLNVAGSIMGRIQGETVIYSPILWNSEPPLTLRGLFPLLPHVTAAMSEYLPYDLRPVASDEFGGFLLAITIGVTAIAFSLPLGIVLALGRQSDMLIVKTLSVGFIEFIRGVPLITLLFTASLLLQYFLPPGTSFDIILRVIILVTLFAAAYLAEVIRGGLAALPRGQYEAADALGLDYWRAQRLIILPQALKISIPSIVSTFIGLFKDTTLVSFVGLYDPLRGITNAVRSDINWKGIYWEPYIFVGALFFIICFGMSRYSMYLENKLKTDHR
jgi:general L-amino acid transport system permease protein